MFSNWMLEAYSSPSKTVIQLIFISISALLINFALGFNLGSILYVRNREVYA
jgi:hypothetical protein